MIYYHCNPKLNDGVGVPWCTNDTAEVGLGFGVYGLGLRLRGFGGGVWRARVLFVPSVLSLSLSLLSLSLSLSLALYLSLHTRAL